MSIAKRNLLIMWFCNFLVAASMTMVVPFISLYIETFGDFSDEYVQRWAGLVFGVTFISAFLFSPLWGKIGDKYGFKPILLITGFGIALSVFIMGIVSNVIGLFILRMFMGIVTGFIPTSIALISKQTPKSEAGKTLGTLQMGNVSGSLFGPLLGGLMADTFGFQYTFILTSIGVAIASTVVLFGIREIKQTEEELKNIKPHTSKDVIKLIFNRKLLIMVMLVALLIQIGNFSIQPLLALYVSDLTKATSVAFLSGMAFSATGFGNLLLTRQWGKLGDSIGFEKVLLILLVLASILIVPQAFVSELWQLVLLRFLYGMAVGGMLPCITAYIRLEAPLDMQGEVLGYNQSFRFLGNVIGPALGGFVAGFGGISSVFYVTGSLFLVGFVLLFVSLKHTEQKNLSESF
ncbi:MFS transporter [Lederbergia galactosidilytica]|uniref:MFS transporter n=1 Tax=Lederbergia galactosidilytica TaxID=217031 RepID=A0A177ZJ51_9BACI|nr:MFS transporter [Lederbergia galactosidilytica]KRG15276.1 MFS transporter [Virgibacillus soli]OAK68001.1 MFS transporter [Lederbergia galactosidilytica]